MCFSEIDSRAKKCPHCTSLQAKFSNLENSPILIGLVGLFILGIFSFTYYETFYVKELEEKALKELQVTVAELSTKVEQDGLYVACLGEINNKSDFSFEDVKYHVNLFSPSEELVDTFSITDEEIKLASNTSTNFRVRGIAQKSAEAYSQCQVTIADAWGRS
ncbi:hypothetical protein [Thalassotalea maritima]|uniref:hypothetical protein n=1 Tax=Thalassotalea maritima TaxID=3242416 RepID=UPI0035295F26